MRASKAAAPVRLIEFATTAAAVIVGKRCRAARRESALEAVDGLGVTVGDVTPHASPLHSALPPGQRRVAGFPRFGTHLHHPPPTVPPNPVIDVTGAAIGSPLTVAVPDLEGLPRVERVADFHCVAGWSATGLRWEGVSFATFYRALIEPRLTPEATVTHIVFRGLDGYGSIVVLDDALAEDVLIATQLDGEPLSSSHGAPVRLVSPSQYGFISTKHLCAIELHPAKPRDDHPYSVVTRSHPRARVWKEERHPWFPAAVLRPAYRALIRPIAWLSSRGAD